MSKDKFTRTDIQAILTAADMDTDKARKTTAGIIEAMTAALAAGRVIELRGLGSLELKERKAYKARNPKTGEPLIAPARRRVVFRPGQELKAALQIKPEV